MTQVKVGCDLRQKGDQGCCQLRERPGGLPSLTLRKEWKPLGYGFVATDKPMKVTRVSMPDDLL